MYCSDTVGVCLTNDLPSCFSERERLFILDNMVQDFREIFIAMEELMGYKLNIDVSGKLSNISKLSELSFLSLKRNC